MPRPVMKSSEIDSKPKDFFGSIKRLFFSLNNWKYFLILSLVLAMTSSILSLVAPNKLSSLTDIITDGLVPNISEDIIKDIMSSDDISVSDKLEFNNLLESYDGENQNNLLKKMDKLPKSIYNKIKPTINMGKVKSIVILLFILYLLSALFNYIESLIMTTVSNKYANRLRNKISKKINKLPLSFFDTHEQGDILSRVTNDVDTISQNLNQSAATLVSSITLFVGSVIMMFVTNYIMAITAIVSSLFGFLFMGLILKNSQKYFTKRQEELGNINGYIEEVYSNHTVVKVYNGENECRDKFDKINSNLLTYNKKSAFYSGLMQPIMGFVGNLGYVCVCVVGAILVSKSIISFGVIVAFMVYVRIFTNPLSQIAQSVQSLQSVSAASERVFDFLDQQEMSDERKLKGFLDKNKVKGKIEFKNVKFGYNSSKIIIKDFSVKVKPGQKVAIVGPTGAGKTTLVNLLMKFYEINSGDILIDDISIKDLTRENIHDLFVMVLQDTWLFNGTIKENLKFNKKNISEEEILSACKIVGVDHFINTLSNGIDTIVGDNDLVSSGEKQLLTITRGMIENAPFLILDEATSNVDTRTEELVQKAMDKLCDGKTSFIIAHRLSTIKNADIILVMNEGNIIEQGTHNSLMKKNGFYAKLYNSQFKK